MSSLKSLITAALYKCATPSKIVTDLEEYATPEEARDAFIALVIAELFPGEAVPEPPKLTIVAPPPVEEKKKRGPMSEEAKAAMKAKREATKAAKAAPAPAPPAPAPAPEKPSEKANAAADSPLPPSPKKKAPPKKKAAPAADVNLPKIDPTWRKHLKAADKERSKELEPELLTYLNALSKEDFNAKKAEDHIQDFLVSLKATSTELESAELLEVDFNGKQYLVNPDTKRVYEITGYDADENPNATPVGYVGMAAFTEMTVPE